MKTSDEFEEAFKLLGNSKRCHDTLLVTNMFANYMVLVIQVLIECTLKYLKKSTKEITKLLIYCYCHHVAVLLDFTFYV